MKLSPRSDYDGYGEGDGAGASIALPGEVVWEGLCRGESEDDGADQVGEGFFDY